MNPRIMSIGLLMFVASRPCALAEHLPLHESLIALNTPQGEAMLERSRFKRNFVKLATNYETQENLSYCGPASSVMVLNAIGAKRPPSPDHGKFKLFTQTNFFNETVAAIKPPKQVAQSGMSLHQLAKALNAHDCTAEATFAADTTLDEFRKFAKDVLTDPNRYLIANYHRQELPQSSGGGHFSPLGAYDEESDRFLILDVSRYKYPPVWVASEALWRSMLAKTKAAGKSRGYVVIQKKGMIQKKDVVQKKE